MEIKQLNHNQINKIITRDELKNIANAEQYAIDMVARSDALLAKTQLECEELKSQTVDSVTQDITSSNAKILEEFDIKLEAFLKNLSSDTYTIVYKILQKLGIEITNPSQIYQLITNELSCATTIKEATISVNSAVLVGLQQEFIKHESKLQIDWNIDNKLLQNECICSTKLWTIKLDLSTVVDYLNKFSG